MTIRTKLISLGIVGILFFSFMPNSYSKNLGKPGTYLQKMIGEVVGLHFGGRISSTDLPAIQTSFEKIVSASVGRALLAANPKVEVVTPAQVDLVLSSLNIGGATNWATPMTGDQLSTIISTKRAEIIIKANKSGVPLGQSAMLSWRVVGNIVDYTISAGFENVPSKGITTVTTKIEKEQAVPPYMLGGDYQIRGFDHGIVETENTISTVDNLPQSEVAEQYAAVASELLRTFEISTFAKERSLLAEAEKQRIHPDNLQSFLSESGGLKFGKSDLPVTTLLKMRDDFELIASLYGRSSSLIEEVRSLESLQAYAKYDQSLTSAERSARIAELQGQIDPLKVQIREIFAVPSDVSARTARDNIIAAARANYVYLRNMSERQIASLAALARALPQSTSPTFESNLEAGYNIVEQFGHDINIPLPVRQPNQPISEFLSTLTISLKPIEVKAVPTLELSAPPP